MYSNDTKLRYDSLSTVSNFCIVDKKHGIHSMFDSLLEENDIEINPFTNEIDEDPQIVWMDYRENYVLNKREFIGANDDDDDDDDDEVMTKFFPIGMMGGDVHEVTPWGKFLESDPMNPMHIYEDIKVMHFKGFSFEDLVRLELTMNAIRGIARWSIIDKYSAIICIAKLYSSAEVTQQVENVIFNNLNIKKFSAFEESAITAQKESESFKTDHILLVFPNGERKLIESPVEQDFIDVDNVLNNIKNSIAFRGGEIYEARTIGS